MRPQQEEVRHNAVLNILRIFMKHEKRESHMPMKSITLSPAVVQQAKATASGATCW